MQKRRAENMSEMTRSTEPLLTQSELWSLAEASKSFDWLSFERLLDRVEARAGVER
jgi:hypothetical protein